MGAHCCHTPTDAGNDPRYRRVLWLVMAINAAMFVVEIVAGVSAQSASLLADALDFLGDTATYGISLMVMGLALQWRARAALLKGATMVLFGLWVIGNAVYNSVFATVPVAEVMGVIGVLALLANLGAVALLLGFRGGDANMRSVWICSRNDAIGNVAVIAAASGVFATNTGWPDVIVAGIMASLALWGAYQIIGHALAELRTTPQVLHHHGA